MKAKIIKRKRIELIRTMSASPQLFLRNPAKDFTRKRKLSFGDTVSFLLQTEGRSTTNEMLDFWKCSPATPTASALRQQRNKIRPEAFEFLFHKFTENCTDKNTLYRGYRLLAIDGSDLLTATGSSDPDSYYPIANGQKSYNILHLNALYDLKQKVYEDAIVQKSRRINEHKALCDMVDRSTISNAIVLADRGFDSFNNLAHLQEKGWKFLIRAKDRTGGISSGFDLPDSDEFDMPVSLNLCNKQSNDMKLLYKDRNHYRYIPHSSSFDYLPSKTRKSDPIRMYTLNFRVIRVKISDSSYEILLTNLDFPLDELKSLYTLRWGIESSFRDLKYSVGLSSFHSKKVEHILQEIFARLTMYNFAELITLSVVIRQNNRKFLYQVNFSASVHICRQIFRGNVSPPDAEALISRYVSPVRPNRSLPRMLTPKGVVSFLYTIA